MILVILYKNKISSRVGDHIGPYLYLPNMTLKDTLHGCSDSIGFGILIFMAFLITLLTVSPCKTLYYIAQYRMKN